LRPVYAEFYQATGKPIMITEFAFSGFPYPGHLSDLFVDVYRQDHRGRGYQAYVQGAARAPFMVGMHWFMWMDYPEDAGGKDSYPYPPDRNIGLVSNDESMVYEELASWVARTNREVEATHRKARLTSLREPTSAHLTVKRFRSTVDGDLTEWPQGSTFRPITVNALVDNAQRGPTYALSWDEQGLYLAGDITDTSLEPTHPGRPWHGDQLAFHLSPLLPAAGTQGDAAMIIIYPIGAGPDQQQPYAVQWRETRHTELLALPVVKRRKPGGYTLEALIPATALKAVSEFPGGSWQLQLWYRNVGEISQSSWEGIITLER
jgi:hypothetical protein